MNTRIGLWLRQHLTLRPTNETPRTPALPPATNATGAAATNGRSDFEAAPAGAAQPALRADGLSPVEAVILKAWMKRGDTARVLGGTTLTNEVGTAMMLQQNNVPSSANDRALLDAGRWPFFQGKPLHAIALVCDSLRTLNQGAEPVRVASLPVLIRDESATTQTVLFRVDDAKGATRGFVDSLGRIYRTLDQWRAENKLPAAQLLYPERGHLTPDAHELPKLTREVSVATVDTTGEKVAEWAERIGVAAGLVLGGAAILGIGGTALTIGGTVLGVAYGIKGVLDLKDSRDHHETLNPFVSTEARGEWFNVVGGGLGLGTTVSSTMGFQQLASAGLVSQTIAPALAVSSQFAYTAQNIDTAHQLVRDWESLSAQDRMLTLAQLGFFVVGTHQQGSQAGGVLNLYSVRAMKAQLAALDQ